MLGVDLTTVTRAYAAARARGLVEGAVGRGTFVRANAADGKVSGGGLRFTGAATARRVRRLDWRAAQVRLEAVY